MRIGIDAREMCGRTTGAGRYLGGLIAAWRQDAAGHTFVLYAPEAIPQLSGGAFETRVVPGGGGTSWEQRALPAAAAGDHLDCFFAPAYTAPLRLRVPLTLALHDVSFAAHPEWFTAREGLRRRWIAGRAAAHARAVITISQFSRREIVTHLGIPDERIHVVPPGIRRPAAPPTPVARRPSVLYVGSIFNRRHVPDLLRAFRRLLVRRPEVHLDLVGDNRSHPHLDLDRLVDHLDLRTAVTWHHYVTDAVLSELYAAAGAFAFLSEYEGLGLTPLEALAAGIPPVLIDTAVARESCGPAALYVPRDDVAAAAAALERALFDDAVRDAVLTEAQAVLARYDWTAAASATLRVITADA
jgi:glycosyltransferase involved in cell wall biosynthesis